MMEQVLGSRSAAAWSQRPITAVKDTDSTWCPNQSYWEFIPATVSTIQTGSSQWSGSCFQNMQANVRWSAQDEISVDLVGSNPTEICGDLYIVSTSYDQRWIYLEDFSPNSTVKFSNITGNRALDVHSNGVSVLVAPCGLLGTVASVVKTLSLFLGDGETLFDANIDFLEEKGLLAPNTPLYNQTQSVPASMIKSGDYLAVLRLDGLDPLIAFGTGGVTGHSTVAVWQGEGASRQLYIVESTDADPVGKVYWPPPYGIIRTPYDQWIQQAQAAQYHVNLLPISPKLTFDEDAFWAWFSTVQGEEYGYSRMLLSFLDTANPQWSLPEPIDDRVEVWLLNTLDMLLPYDPSDPGAKVTTYRMLIAAANHRLNSTCFSVACLQDIVVPRNQTVVQVLAMPELDSYTYNGSAEMVCSEFAARTWQHGFGSQFPPMQGSEQTPKDNYQMAVFDPTFFDKSNCPNGLRESPNGNYCQLMGQWQLDLNEYNTISLYAQMNTHCGSQWPKYQRCPDGTNNCKC